MRVILYFILILVASSLLGYCDFVSARHYLERRYSHVEHVRMQVFQFSCFRTKDRMKFDFDATRPDGTKVSGYLCYDGPLDWWPVIHEDS